MLSKIIKFSIKNRFIIFLFTFIVAGFGIYSVQHLSIGAVPDVTNNQVQVITTSRNLSTLDIEKYITYPVELEMSNLPGVEEIRSTSKFGLSVVTIVFKEKMGTYLPRQLIAEKLIKVRENIPEGFGSPEMGPITTGLGEVYQYILDVKEGYKDQYDAMSLRTIQDWIVKRQLSGIEGVVEINTWGGLLKQYEVAVNTQKLNAMDVSISDIFTALEKNNSVAGGGYIEKVNQSYFIRGEGLITDLDDIRKTVIGEKDGIPVLIEDVAQVGYGSATRFGAVTANGEGEKVMGQVMMLKGANEKNVMDAIHKRVKEIQKSLPEGVYINPFLDRSELVAKTTFTIYENLILGSLIVVFIVILLLGNWRSGLVISSIIPLALLFTLGLMYIFGVDANLMSLGAIDFGIIIDGAVIIVEFIAFQMFLRRKELFNLDKVGRQAINDEITHKAATKMMSSAIFGQLIILIVFLPILTLGGVEGKMFRPMAITFSFAIIGAMILGMTYVPALASVALKPVENSKNNISFRLMNFINRMYDPSIRWAMNHRKFVIGGALIVLVSAFFIFSKLGAEFVPTLDEGDFVIQPVLKTGTSLKKTTETTTKVESILKQFPEVRQVVSRIGAGEVPTDPMSMEEADIFISLKPKNEWKTAETKDELANKFKEALAVIPNVEMEFTQPIEMRFNELISGARSDIAIKIFGEDLDILYKKANEIKSKIQNIPGAADITVEKVAGLPQMLVKFDRNKIARYGLNIADINKVITMGFSGEAAGIIFEGEKRFDLVVRLDSTQRKDLDNLKNLYIDLPSGGKIPMSEVAEIKYAKAAAKISRDDTHRRIVIGVNVRDRDLQSVVDDIKNVVDKQIKLPIGYYITYGGQFENLQSAKQRLLIVVPIALLLIFVMLYFAFQSVKEALMIYTAIPFATVGGIILLWLRGMPFSISAGVGFIALFGIAVLNGIVLIEHYKELRKERKGVDLDLIITGAKDRMRAVLLTAMAAALGFLPMAISQGAGAEVQRPLATVVIGGLVTSTLLTLIVLPVLYYIFNTKIKKVKLKRNLGLLMILLTFSGLQAQEKPVDLDRLIEMAIQNNSGLKALEYQVKKENTLIKSGANISNANVYYQYEKDRITETEGIINSFGISQDFDFPSLYKTQKDIQKTKASLAENSYEMRKLQLIKDLKQAYYQYQYTYNKYLIYKKLDSIYKDFAHKAQRKFELGESNYLEALTSKAKQKEISIDFARVSEDLKIVKAQIQTLVQADKKLNISVDKISKYSFSLIPESRKLIDDYLEKQSLLSELEIKRQKRKMLPGFSLGYETGTHSIYGSNIQTIQAGLTIPLFNFRAKNNRIKAAKIQLESMNEQKKELKKQFDIKLSNLIKELEKHKQALQYYEKDGLNLSQNIYKMAQTGYQQGEIDFFQFIRSLENSNRILLNYLDELNLYNQTAITIDYFNIIPNN